MNKILLFVSLALIAIGILGWQYKAISFEDAVISILLAIFIKATLIYYDKADKR